MVKTFEAFCDRIKPLKDGRKINGYDKGGKLSCRAS